MIRNLFSVNILNRKLINKKSIIKNNFSSKSKKLDNNINIVKNEINNGLNLKNSIDLLINESYIKVKELKKNNDLKFKYLDLPDNWSLPINQYNPEERKIRILKLVNDIEKLLIDSKLFKK